MRGLRRSATTRKCARIRPIVWRTAACTNVAVLELFFRFRVIICAVIKTVIFLTALAGCLAACNSEHVATTTFQTTSPRADNPCSSYTCDGPGAQLNVSYPYRLFTHCGVVSTRFNGQSFYVAAIDPFTVISGLRNPEDAGTMTLVSPHAAVFRASSGQTIPFVDSPPGSVGVPYPLTVSVSSGGNQLVDRPFAGFVWKAQGTLPGVSGPPYGNGQDSFIHVPGTMTMTGPESATFRSNSGAQVQFVHAAMGCD